MAATTAVSGTAMTLHPGADTAVLPGRHLAAENIPGFHNDGGVAGIRQVFGTGESSKTSSGNSDAHAAVSKVKPTLKGLDPRSLLKVVSAFPWARLG